MQVCFERWEGSPLDAKVLCRDVDGEIVTPVFSGCIELYNWLRINGWKQAHNFDHGNTHYEKGVAVYTKGI